MQKIIYNVSDILEEFKTRADMKGFSPVYIGRIIPFIIADDFKLIKHTKIIYGDKTYRKYFYICERIENGELDSDDWVQNPDRFLGSIAESYIRQIKRGS